MWIKFETKRKNIEKCKWVEIVTHTAFIIHSLIEVYRWEYSTEGYFHPIRMHYKMQAVAVVLLSLFFVPGGTSLVTSTLNETLNLISESRFLSILY